MMHKALKHRVLSGAKRLACGLLHAPARTLPDTLVYAVVIYAVGCIIPTPLDQQPLQENFPPVIRADKVMPPFGPIVHQQDDLFDVQIFASDPDDNLPTSQDSLRFRLYFRLADGKLSYDGNEQFMMTSAHDPNDPTLVTATTSQRFCQGRTGTYYLYVIVADRPFSTTEDTKVVDGGGSDQNYWVLTCS
jgi:hypothetical protein